MSLLWADDFSAYGIGGQAYLTDGPYAEVKASPFVTAPVLAADPDPAGTGAAVLKLTTQSNGNSTYPTTATYVRKVNPVAKTTIGGFFRLWLPNLPTAATVTTGIVFADSTNAPQFCLYVSTTGAIVAALGWLGTVKGTSSVALTANAWHHVEWKLVASATTGGSIEVRVDGAVVLNVSGIATVSTAEVSYSQESLVGSNSVTPYQLTPYYRDWVLWDTAGTYNNDFMGPCFVQRRTVNSDVSFNWTPSSGTTGYNLIDEAGPNDADYISADVTQTTASEFGVENLPSDATSVRGMVIVGRMKASDGGDCKVQMGVVSGGTPGLGTDRQITTAYTYWADIREVDPSTGLPFTPVGFNNMTLTIDRTT